MKKLMAGTHAVSVDEKAFGLVEVNLPPPDFKAKRRYQIIYVNRDDKLAEFRKDLGLSKNFAGMEFRIPSLWACTVGELRDVADQLRATPRRLADLLPDWDYNQRIKTNASLFGPGWKIQRAR